MESNCLEDKAALLENCLEILEVGNVFEIINRISFFLSNGFYFKFLRFSFLLLSFLFNFYCQGLSKFLYKVNSKHLKLCSIFMENLKYSLLHAESLRKKRFLSVFCYFIRIILKIKLQNIGYTTDVVSFFNALNFSD